MKKAGLSLLLVFIIPLVMIGCTQSKADVGNADEIVVQGVIEAKEIDLNTKIPGRIEKLLVAEGDKVKAEDLLVKIASDEIEARKSQAQALVEAARGNLEAAQAAKASAKAQLKKAENGARQEKLAQAKANYELMKKTYERIKNLHKKDAVSDQKKDEVKTKLKVAEEKYKMAKKGARNEDVSSAQAMVVQANAMVNAARSKLEEAKAGLQEVNSYLQDTKLEAPLTGVITSINVDEGELVSKGMPILTVTDLSEPWIEVNVEETKLDKVQLGQKVDVKLLSKKEKTYTGEVVRINKNPDFATKRATNANGSYDIVTYGVRVELENPQLQLRPGMTAIVNFSHN